MKKRGILHPQTCEFLARQGHRDRFAITDAGYNIPKNIERIDLAFLPNTPEILQVVDAVRDEIVVEKVMLASESKEDAPELWEEYIKRFDSAKTEIEFIPHVEFDELMPTINGAIRTGGYMLHAPNIILQAGCTYD